MHYYLLFLKKGKDESIQVKVYTNKSLMQKDSYTYRQNGYWVSSEEIFKGELFDTKYLTWAYCKEVQSATV